jgi:Protein of unknown function (DUF1592)/Protein of unknown function (DUF1588)/Protein of unknown function (DUF1595)/Protein of unknown function (DUF1585)
MTSMRLLVVAVLLAGACSGSIAPTEPGGGPANPPSTGGRPPSSPGSGSGASPGSGSGSQPPGLQPPGMTPPGTSPPVIGPPPDPSSCSLPPPRIWALTPEQYVRSVQGLLPGAAVSVEALTGTVAAQVGFSNEASRLVMTEPHLGQMLELAYRLANDAAADPTKLAPCLAQPAPAAACVRDFVQGFMTRAFRRAVTAAEVDALATQHARAVAAGDGRAALRQVLMAVLTSPSMLFRTELGAETGSRGVITLTPFEKASALSFFLTDGPPDAELQATASSGALDRKEELEAQTRRLLAKPESAQGLTRFASDLFGTRAVLDANKDVMVFPAWTDQLAADLAAEAEAFLTQVIWNEDGRLGTVLTAPFSMLNARLAGFYGVGETVPATGLRKVAFRAGQRAGVFTLGALQATLAKDNDTDAVSRGRFLREVLVCQQLPEPPANLNVVPPPPDGKQNMRERLARHSADPSCATCHKLMDPLGLAFEIYDGIGRFRTTDLGKPIDAAGTLVGAAPEGATFSNGLQLLEVLGNSPDVASCFVKTAFRYSHGREPLAADACTVDRLSRRFASTGGRILDLAVALTTDDSFLQRQIP